VGKLSDRFGRRPFFIIGPLANVAVSLLQIRCQHKA
jgi:MFS family permease